ncbi:sterile alpha motif domain-containing protein 1-like [Schistocerca piceifrons]|uniref:sterile alpha motif domain-containing protein 1-like n=1 Tax=Schistocerca piceifrons TaxID=274613 RepID=UPI001F5F6720|nr:sterile alpha motif domain-containing protein 1-like [Schistocerca piceifrons]
MRATPPLSHADEAGKRRGGQQPRRPLFAARRPRRGPSKISPLTPTVFPRPGELQDACSHRRRFQLPSPTHSTRSLTRRNSCRAILRRRKTPIGVSFAAAASGATSAVPTASAAPTPAASEVVPTPEAPAPPPQLLVAEPGTASPEASRRPDRAPPTAGAGVTAPWVPSAQHRQSSSPRWTLTAKQPRLPLPATGPRRLPPPLTWPASSRSSLPW